MIIGTLHLSVVEEHISRFVQLIFQQQIFVLILVIISCTGTECVADCMTGSLIARIGVE